MNDETDIPADSHRPEIGISRPIDAMKLHPGIRGIQLQVKHRGLDGLLLIASQFGEAIGESIRDAELHGQVSSITSKRHRFVDVG